MFRFTLISLMSLVNLCIYCSACPGCLDLDELTFDKTIKKFRTALVKFDQSFPYGEKHETFAAFSLQINNKTISGTDHPDVLIATVGVKDYGDNENKNLAERYGVKTDTFPSIKLFIEGNLDSPIDFEIGSDFTITKLFTFLKEHSNVHILAPGCDIELDKLSDKFLKDSKTRGDILKQAEEIVGKIECDERKQLLKFYPSLMKGILEKGEDFIRTQNERMQKLLKDKISKKKQEEINKKLNIIASFKITKTSTKNEL